MKTTLTHFIPGYKYLSEATITDLIRDLQYDLRTREGERASAAAFKEAEKSRG